MRMIWALAMLAGCDLDKDGLIDVLSQSTVECVALADGWEVVTVGVGRGVPMDVDVCDAAAECRPAADWWQDGGQVMIADCDEPDGYARVTYYRPAETGN